MRRGFAQAVPRGGVSVAESSPAPATPPPPRAAPWCAHPPAPRESARRRAAPLPVTAGAVAFSAAGECFPTKMQREIRRALCCMLLDATGHEAATRTPGWRKVWPGDSALSIVTVRGQRSQQGDNTPSTAGSRGGWLGMGSARVTWGRREIAAVPGRKAPAEGVSHLRPQQQHDHRKVQVDEEGHHRAHRGGGAASPPAAEAPPSAYTIISCAKKPRPTSRTQATPRCPPAAPGEPHGSPVFPP